MFPPRATVPTGPSSVPTCLLCIPTSRVTIPTRPAGIPTQPATFPSGAWPVASPPLGKPSHPVRIFQYAFCFPSLGAEAKRERSSLFCKSGIQFTRILINKQ
ncbi:MAG TPA: hypothetical protein DD458_04870 [Prolixibacteraceae bacterium]|nr:hypothetical protein [Prolixibacteraceae bacterium]HCR89009.1 hypothetical protein [Prolixibacteraceae bacterium]HCU61309.1 hypothetical protein [Prolixibacteraceae bacterium]